MSSLVYIYLPPPPTGWLGSPAALTCRVTVFVSVLRSTGSSTLSHTALRLFARGSPSKSSRAEFQGVEVPRLIRPSLLLKASLSSQFFATANNAAINTLVQTNYTQLLLLLRGRGPGERLLSQRRCAFSILIDSARAFPQWLFPPATLETASPQFLPAGGTVTFKCLPV